MLHMFLRSKRLRGYLPDTLLIGRSVEFGQSLPKLTGSINDVRDKFYVRSDQRKRNLGDDQRHQKRNSSRLGPHYE